jgi:hypothetical protein
MRPVNAAAQLPAVRQDERRRRWEKGNFWGHPRPRQGGFVPGPPDPVPPAPLTIKPPYFFGPQYEVLLCMLYKSLWRESAELVDCATL